MRPPTHSPLTLHPRTLPQALDIASRAKISGLGLSPVCPTTLRLIRDATAPCWSPRTHGVFPDAYRAGVHLLLCISERHLRFGYNGAVTTAMMLGEVTDVPLALPVDDIWVDRILPFLGRDAFRREPHPKRCEYCGAAAGIRCPACREAHYCGDEHRRAAWKDHKTRCSRVFRPKKKAKGKKKGGGRKTV